jgi:hypothetical protein
MKHFTVKDFIAYNNPCFSCNQNVSITFGVAESGVDGWAYLKPLITTGYTSIDLKITYTKTLKLVINHTTNKFTASDLAELASYLSTHRIFLRSQCDKCYSIIDSCYLDLNLNKGFIHPTTISQESLIVTDDKNMYHVYSSFASENSVIIVDKLDKPASPIRFDAPLITLSKFKNKERFLNKMRTYLVFS